MAVEGSSQQVLLYGGRGAGAPFNDTWRWDGMLWTQVADTGPKARAGHGMAFDAARQRVVLFGGESATGHMGDTWEWVVGEWQQVQDVGPSPRSLHAMAYDAVAQRVVVFGGADAAGTGLGDTWSWDGTNWTQVADTGPSGRAGAAMVPDGSGLILFGGIDSLAPLVSPAVPTIHGDTWHLGGGLWVQVQDMGPSPCWLHSLAFDPQTGRVTMFGGASAVGATPPGSPAGFLDDTWEHVGTSVSQPPPPAGAVNIAYAHIVSGTNVLANAGDSLLIDFGLIEPAPQPINIQAIAVVQTATEWQMVAGPGLDLPGLVQIDTGAQSAQFTVTRGTEPLDPGAYGVALVIESTGVVGGLVEFQVA
jgi:hypothetical protein